MDPDTERMLRFGVAYAASRPENYNANMHALSFLYLSHLRTRRRGEPMNAPAGPMPPPQVRGRRN